MNSFRNNVQLIGRLGQAPEVKDFNGNKMARFSIAINDYMQLKNGEKKETTYWHNVIFWGRQAENVEKILAKGTEVLVEGKLVSRSWDDRDGNKRYSTEVLGDHFLLVDSSKKISGE